MIQTMLALLAALAAATAPGALVGKPAPAIQISDGEGGDLSLAALRGRVVVLVFVGARCPVSGAYAERLKVLADEFAGRVTFAGIDSTPATATEVKEHAARKGFPFPVVKDDARAVADRYGVTKVPQVIVVDPAGMVRYRGRIDNSQDESRVERRELKDALSAIAAGQAPPVAQTVPMGCALPAREPQAGR